jgi:2-iminobutanoate/2-iminopropanoate deaminase
MSMRELFLGDGPIPVGLRVDELIHGVRLPAANPASALRDLRRAVEAAGASVDNVAQVSFFVRDPAGLPAINPAWLELFPDEHDRPTYKFMVADLSAEQPVHVEFFAVAGERRTLLHLPNVAHANPIPMGVRIGRYLFSSRVLPYDPASGLPPPEFDRQAECLLGNVRGLLALGGASAEHISQARLFLADPATLPIAARLWQDLVGEHPAALQVTPYALAPALKIMLELVAIVS